MVSFSDPTPLAPAPASAQAGWLEALGRAFVTRYCRLTVQGSLPGPGQPMLICANHRSHVDSIAVMTALGLPFKQCGILAAKDYFFPGGAWLGAAARCLHLVPVERQPHRGDFARTIDACAAFLAAGGAALLAYPEGTRGSAPGTAPFKRGPALLAVSLKLPILPVYIAGSDRILGKGRRLPRPGRIDIAIGAPIWPAPARSRAERRAGSIELSRRVEDAVRALAGNIRP